MVGKGRGENAGWVLPKVLSGVSTERSSMGGVGRSRLGAQGPSGGPCWVQEEAGPMDEDVVGRGRRGKGHLLGWAQRLDGSKQP